MARTKLFPLTALLLPLFFAACTTSQTDTDTINLKDRFYWAECDENSTVEEAERLRFHKFSTSGVSNIRKVAGRNQDYVWLKLTFFVPEALQNKALGLFISYLHFADKVWVNGVYVGGSGQFPPKAKGSLWSSHFYHIPAPLIEPNERNTVLIKVYCKGKSGISDRVLLGEFDTVKEIHTFHTFLQSTIYLFAAGGMLFTALLFLMIFIWRKKEREYLTLSLLCISSMIFMTPFFVSQLPITYPNNLPFILFIKSTLCEGIFLIMFCLSTLVIEFVKKEESNIFRAVRLAILVVSSVIAFAAPSYDTLASTTPLEITLSLAQILLGFIFILKSRLTPQQKQAFKTVCTAFIPVSVSIPIDIVIKGAVQKVDYPYLTLIGWLITILDFIIIMSIRYNRAVAQNEYLTIELQNEVRKQTHELSEQNTKLEDEIRRAETDLEMASLVQKKFFPYPPRSLRGWDIAVSYSPLDKVSGDMYDFYHEGDSLNGFSLFDVSGHGIAASLVTMLAKNIIFQSFLRNQQNNETVSRTLYEINDEIIEAKGGIENYLTGLMFRFGSFDKNDECLVEMANAGHPNPILYSAKSNICDEIESGEEHHGAIGLDFITVSFPQTNFTMAEDDILLFYTDGLSEGRSGTNEMFGKERIKRILKECYAKDAQSIMEDIIDAYHDFTRGAKRDDDITVIVLKRENSGNFIAELADADDFLG